LGGKKESSPLFPLLHLEAGSVPLSRGPLQLMAACRAATPTQGHIVSCCDTPLQGPILVAVFVNYTPRLPSAIIHRGVILYANVVTFLFVLYSKAISGFQTFHTLPAKSGLDFNVALPGCQPEGVTSPVLRTCWNAWTCLIISATLRPTGGVTVSMA
jgi:hypothetical protein